MRVWSRVHGLAMARLVACLAVLWAAGCDDEDEDPCDEVDCSGHGACAVQDGAAICVCEAGFAGADCGECAPGLAGEGCDECRGGYQDNDRDGSCLPDCATAGLDCGDHGECVDRSGVARCDCDTNYAGVECDLCASGYQDNDSNGTCEPTCANVNLGCGPRSHCDDSSGTAECVEGCAEGYTGPDCEDCATGYQDADDDGSCLPDCATSGLACPAHSACSDARGVVACVCEAGYQDNDDDGSCTADCATSGLACPESETCDDSAGTPRCVCAAGYQDNDANGTCLPDCATAAPDCSGHGTCDDSRGVARCVCDEGYDRSDCGVCESPYYQDNDGDGTCTSTCYFSAATFLCGANEACSHATGALACVCLRGYQDNDEDGTCLPTCRTAMADGLVCPDPNGECTDEGGTASCRCAAGYADDPTAEGEDCLACAAGYQDNDEDGSCRPDCATLVASGVVCPLGCDDSCGIALCNCPDGEQDNDADGTCEPTCETAGLDCDAATEACDDTDGTARCVCVEGYYADGRGGCLALGAGDDCAEALELDLGDGTTFGDVTGAARDFAFDCAWYPVPLYDTVYHFALAAGETRHMRFTMKWFDSSYTSAVFSALLLLEGSDCGSATRVGCAFGLGLDYYFRDSVVEVTLEGGASGQDYWLATGFFDYFGAGVTGFILEVENVCGPGELYSSGTDTCVANPCVPTNPCTEVNRTACAADVTGATPAYACRCDLGFVEDAAGDCVPNPTADAEGCADVLPIPTTPATGTITGTTTGAEDDGEGSCRGSRPAPDRVYGFTLTERTRVGLRLECDMEFDCLMHLRRACDDPSTEVLCHDRGATGGTEETTVTLDAGVYYLFVDGWDDRPDPLLAAGDYTLAYSFHADPCTDEETACPGEPVCRGSADWSSFECVCEDAGEVFHAGACVDDPCEPDPCAELAHTACVPDLATGTHACTCSGIYVADGSGGCGLAADADWTVIVYWAMDNNLYLQTRHELEDVAAAGLTPDVRVVGLADWLAEDGYYAEFGGGRMDRVVELGDPDTSDWRTLRDFAAWAVESYPARHYALVVSDHGGAWRSAAPERLDLPPVLRAICWDDSSPTPETGIGITNGELAAALDGVVRRIGGKLDLLVFDACMMGEWEMTSVCEPYADYMVAAPESTYGFMVENGAWTEWLDTLVAGAGAMGGLELGEALVDQYRRSAATSPYVTTIALTDLSTTEDLNAAVSDFADALLAAESEAFYADLDEVRRTGPRASYPELIDLGDFARRVADLVGAPTAVVAAARALRDQLDLSIVDSYADVGHAPLFPWAGAVGMAGFTGLTVYLPSRVHQMEPAYTAFGAVWSDLASWDEFVESFAAGGYHQCAGVAPVLSHLGTEVTATMWNDDMCPSNLSTCPRYFVQTFRAPGTEIHGVRVLLRKTDPDGGEPMGFRFAIHRPGYGQVVERTLSLEPNDGAPQTICITRTGGFPTEPGEELEIIVGGGVNYPGYPTGYPTPIEWPIEYAADATSPPPYAEGEARVVDGGVVVTVGEYNEDGIEGTFWFEVF